MRTKRNKCLIGLLALVLGSRVLADPTSDSLTQIEEETLVLKAREKQLEVQANIIGKQNEIAVRQSMGNLLIHSPAIGDPVVRAIEGVGKSTYATLQLSDGASVEAKSGDLLPNGMRVLTIGASEVIVQTRQKKRVRLSAQTPASFGFNPYYPSPGVVPPLPASMPRGVAR